MATKSSRMKRALAGILSCATLISSLSLTSTAVSAEETTDTSAGQSEESTTTDSSVSGITITGMEGKYSTYYNSHKDAAKPKKEITVYATDYKEGTIDGTSFVNSGSSSMTAEEAAKIRLWPLVQSAPRRRWKRSRKNPATATTDSSHSSKRTPTSRRIIILQ